MREHGSHGEHGSLLHADETFRIRGAVFEVYKTVGAGFLEAVYQDCLALEFATRGIPFRATPTLRLDYKGVELRATYSPDFICFDSVIVELKAVRELVPEHRAQVLNYLKATGLQVGLLVNFGDRGRAAVERLVSSELTADPHRPTRKEAQHDGPEPWAS